MGKILKNKNINMCTLHSIKISITLDLFYFQNCILWWEKRPIIYIQIFLLLSFCCICKNKINIYLIFKRFYLCIFREGKGGRKRGRETSMRGCLSCTPYWGTWPATQACALTGNWTNNPLVHRLALNPLSYTSHGSTWKF